MTDRTVLTAHLTGKRLLAAPSQSWQLDFDLDDSLKADFTYEPGQFLSLLFEGTYPDGHALAGQPREETRAYSLAYPSHGAKLQLALNRAGKFSAKLIDLQLGDMIRFHGAYGGFTRRQPHTPSLYFGAGPGIVPIRCIFRDGVPAHSTLIQTAATRDDLLYRDEFAHASTLRYLPMVGPETPAIEARIRKLLLDHPEIQTAYLCGLNDDIAPVRALLKALNWDRKQIIFERYD